MQKFNRSYDYLLQDQSPLHKSWFGFPVKKYLEDPKTIPITSVYHTWNSKCSKRLLGILNLKTVLSLLYSCQQLRHTSACHPTQETEYEANKQSECTHLLDLWAFFRASLKCFQFLKFSQEWIVLQLNLKNNCCFKWGVAAELLTTNLAQISSWNQYNMLFLSCVYVTSNIPINSLLALTWKLWKKAGPGLSNLIHPP